MKYLQEDGVDRRDIALHGNFTYQDREIFLEIVNNFIVSGYPVLAFNFRQITFIDSAALGLLLLAKKEIVAAKKSLLLSAPSSQVERMFSLMNYDKIFTIEGRS